MSSRVQLALNVTDVKAATSFYTQLFGTEPNKVREGYANFAIADPPLKLVLIENAHPDGALNHLGVELEDSAAVESIGAGFAARGLSTRVSAQESCCHAVQDKVYVMAPEVPIGMWEFYTVLQDDPADATDATGICCADPAAPTGGTGTCCGGAGSSGEVASCG